MKRARIKRKIIINMIMIPIQNCYAVLNGDHNHGDHNTSLFYHKSSVRAFINYITIRRCAAVLLESWRSYREAWVQFVKAVKI